MTSAPQSPARLAAFNADALLKSLSVFFDDRGKPTPAFQKVITHFKDRFREVLKTLAETADGAAGRPVVTTTTAAGGGRILMTARVTGAKYQLSDAHFQGVRGRLHTPTMGKLNVSLKSGVPAATAPGSAWESLLTDAMLPTVYVNLSAAKSRDVEVEAAILFHHPEDDAVAEAKGRALTYDALPDDLTVPVNGGLLQVQGDGLTLVNTGVLMVNTGTMAYHPGFRFSLDDKYDPRGWQILEAAQSSRASFEALEQLIARLGLKARRTSRLDDNLDPDTLARAQRAAFRAADAVARAALKPFGRPRKVQDGIYELICADGVKMRSTVYWNVEGAYTPLMRAEAHAEGPVDGTEAQWNDTCTLPHVLNLKGLNLLDEEAMKVYQDSATAWVERNLADRAERARYLTSRRQG